MIKEIAFGELGGSVATAALLTTIDAGVITSLAKVQDLGAITAAVLVVGDAFAAPHLGPVGMGITNGVSVYGVGYLTQWAMRKTVFKQAAPVLVQYVGAGAASGAAPIGSFNMSGQTGTPIVSGDVISSVA